MSEDKEEVFKHPDGYLIVKSEERKHVFGEKTGKIHLYSLVVQNFVGELTPEIESQLESVGIFSVYD